MIVGQRAFAHEAVRHGNAEVIDERAQFVAGIGQHDAAADVPTAAACASAILVTISRAVARSSDGLRRRARIGLEPREQARIHFRRKHVHRNVDQHRTRLPALGQQERLVDDLRKQLRIVDAPGALHERPIDFILRAVGVQVHFLVRVLAEVVRGHIAGDDAPSECNRAPRWRRRSRRW